MTVSPVEMVRRQLAQSTHHIYSLPIVTLMPHSRCNCRCIMCDIWKANRNGQELSREDLLPHLESLQQLRVRWVVLSGGEALMHSNLWELCRLLRERELKISLLSTGLLLERYAAEIVRWCDEVIVSLDGSPALHDAIRNVPRAYERLANGVAALKAARAGFRVTGRTVVQRANYADLPAIIDTAEALGLDQISFLAADVSSTAFNRPEQWETERVNEIALSPAEVAAFSMIVEEVIASRREAFARSFVAESPEKLRRLPRYFAALNGDVPFPAVRCNAPWVSAVVEADGTVRPCFFHAPLGNLRVQPLAEIVNGEQAVAFRRQLDVASNPVCRRCVCTLHLGRRAAV